MYVALEKQAEGRASFVVIYYDLFLSLYVSIILKTEIANPNLPNHMYL